MDPLSYHQQPTDPVSLLYQARQDPLHIINSSLTLSACYGPPFISSTAHWPCQPVIPGKAGPPSYHQQLTDPVSLLYQDADPTGQELCCKATKGQWPTTLSTYRQQLPSIWFQFFSAKCLVRQWPTISLHLLIKCSWLSAFCKSVWLFHNMFSETPRIRHWFSREISSDKSVSCSHPVDSLGFQDCKNKSFWNSTISENLATLGIKNKTCTHQSAKASMV